METTSLISVESIKSDLNAILDTYSDIDLFIMAMENHFLRHTDMKGKLLVDYHTNHHDNAIKMYNIRFNKNVAIYMFI